MEVGRNRVCRSEQQSLSWLSVLCTNVCINVKHMLGRLKTG